MKSSPPRGPVLPRPLDDCNPSRSGELFTWTRYPFLFLSPFSLLLFPFSFGAFAGRRLFLLLYFMIGLFPRVLFRNCSVYLCPPPYSLKVPFGGSLLDPLLSPLWTVGSLFTFPSQAGFFFPRLFIRAFFFWDRLFPSPSVPHRSSLLLMDHLHFFFPLSPFWLRGFPPVFLLRQILLPDEVTFF